MISIYWRACSQAATSLDFTSLTIGLWTVMVFHNITESSFVASLLWPAMLLCSIDIPRPDSVKPAEWQRRAVKRQPTAV
jgi:hypothetical protein